MKEFENKIFDAAPENWRDLQSLVCQMFNEMGCKAHVEYCITHVRGVNEVDVYVEDNINGMKYIYLIECKHWKQKIPQEKISALRSILMDVGAHRGFLVADSGFQKGSYEKTAFTNIDLMSFDEIQSVFFHRWKFSITREMSDMVDHLFPYWDPSGGRMPKFQWGDEHRKRHKLLCDAYRPLLYSIGHYFMPEMGYSQMVLPRIDSKGMESGKFTINSWRSLYNFFKYEVDNAYYHFKVLHGEIEPNRFEGEYRP